VRSNRAFLGQVVRYLAGEAGIRQFLDIGTGIPSGDNVHRVAQQAAPDARIVNVDNDPIVLAHAHELLKGTAAGATVFIQGDLHDPDTIVGLAGATLDFTMQAEEIAALARSVPAQARYLFAARTHDEVSRFFDGLELVEPGVVPIDRWRPGRTGCAR
jgi:hypothetical protein